MCLYAVNIFVYTLVPVWLAGTFDPVICSLLNAAHIYTYVQITW